MATTIPPNLPEPALETLRAAMSREAGVVRDAASLNRVLALIDALEREHGPCAPLISARLIAAGALARRESRGAHYRTDYPGTDAEPRRAFVRWSERDAAPGRQAAE